MRKFAIIGAVAILTIMVGIGLTGCGRSNEPPTWESYIGVFSMTDTFDSITGTITITLNEDGTGKYHSIDTFIGEQSTTLTFTVGGLNITILMENVGDLNETVEFAGTFSNGFYTLTIDMASIGQTLTLNRVA